MRQIARKRIDDWRGNPPTPAIELDFRRGIYPANLFQFFRSTTGYRVNQSKLLESVAVNTPRITHDPVTGMPLGMMVEEARTNLVVNSNDFTQATWGVQNATNTAAAGTSPDGTNNATFLKPSAGNTAHVGYANSFAVTANKTYTFSVWVKANGYNFVGLSYHDSSPTAGHESIRVFDLVNGTIGNAYNVTPSLSKIEAFANGWYRLTIASQFATSLANVGLWPMNADTDPRAGFNANGTSGVLHCFWQFEMGDVPTSYIPTGAAAITRGSDQAFTRYVNLTTWPWMDRNPYSGTVAVDFSAYALPDPQGGAQRTVYEVATAGDRSAGKAACYIYDITRGLTCEVDTAVYATVSQIRTPFIANQFRTVVHAWRKQNYAGKVSGIPLDIVGVGGMALPNSALTLEGSDRCALGAMVNLVADSFLNGIIARFRAWNIRLPNEVLVRIAP